MEINCIVDKLKKENTQMVYLSSKKSSKGQNKSPALQVKK